MRGQAAIGVINKAKCLSITLYHRTQEYIKTRVNEISIDPAVKR